MEADGSPLAPFLGLVVLSIQVLLSLGETNNKKRPREAKKEVFKEELDVDLKPTVAEVSWRQEGYGRLL